jgi:hypothetical protein
MSEPLHLLGQQLTPADWSATPESVKWSILVQLSQQINQLEQANQKLRTRVTELEERLKRNSKNSSQPPSQDAPQAKSGKQGGFIVLTEKRGWSEPLQNTFRPCPSSPN